MNKPPSNSPGLYIPEPEARPGENPDFSKIELDSDMASMTMIEALNDALVQTHCFDADSAPTASPRKPKLGRWCQSFAMPMPGIPALLFAD